ncbi:MAG: sulfatase, partial [Planctomycetota bacterium]
TGALLTLAGTGILAGEGRQPPNLLVIHTDEHNFRTLGCYRQQLSPEQAFMWGEHAVVKTPNIDWIAQNGAICNKFYAANPVCSPSRASFISGRYCHNTDVVQNNIPLNDQVVTFAQILREHGYATGYAGKWHLDGEGKPQFGPERKFGFEDNRYMFNRGHWKQLMDTEDGPKVKARWKNGTRPSYRVEGADEESFTTDFLADKTVEFIQDNQNRPFCYMLSIPDPHSPDTVRPPYDSRYEDMEFEPPRTYDKDEEGVPSWARKGKGGYEQSQYYGMVKCIDDNVGKILDCLRRQELLDNTIVLFTSDHGDMRGEHHRQNKSVPLEASAKVPFVIHYPDRIEAGTVIDEALSTADFLPTIVNLMGFSATGEEDGRDASALFTTGRAPSGWKDVTFMRGCANWLAAVTGRYKLVLSDSDDPWLLDTEKDPDELKNFVNQADYRDVAQKLAEDLRDYGRKYGDPRVEQQKTARELEQLIEA